MTIVGDAPSCGIIYNNHSDDSRSVIYTLVLIYSTGISHGDHHTFIIEVPVVPRFEPLDLGL
jgi:hypothetical protein